MATGCGALGTSFKSCNCSKAATTCSMFGRHLESIERHWRASWAALWAPVSEYWLPKRGSSTRKIFLLLERYGRAHSTRLCSPGGLFLSSDLRPDSISNSTTPKLYTSLFDVKWPITKKNVLKYVIEVEKKKITMTLLPMQEQYLLVQVQGYKLITCQFFVVVFKRPIIHIREVKLIIRTVTSVCVCVCVSISTILKSHLSFLLSCFKIRKIILQ